MHPFNGKAFYKDMITILGSYQLSAPTFSLVSIHLLDTFVSTVVYDADDPLNILEITNRTLASYGVKTSWNLQAQIMEAIKKQGKKYNIYLNGVPHRKAQLARFIRQNGMGHLSRAEAIEVIGFAEATWCNPNPEVMILKGVGQTVLTAFIEEMHKEESGFNDYTIKEVR